MRVILSAVLLCSAVTAQDATADPRRATVESAVAWIGRQAVPVPGVDGAMLFPASFGGGAPMTAVYGGSAGVLIFLENAAKVLGSDAAKKLADAAAKGLRASRSVDKDGHASWSRRSPMSTTGLYVGDAGVGQAFLVRSSLRGDAEALATAVEIGDALIARGKKEGDELHWDTQNDVISGAAGTALFLLELGDAAKAERFTAAARQVGHWLVAEADRSPSSADAQKKLPTWSFSMGLGGKMHMPNFSHGTAGVSYALVRIGARTGDAALLQAGKDGAQWLLEHAVVDGDGMKWCANEKGTPRYMGGGCHGPAGTGRLFLLLHALTGEAAYRDAALKGAKFVVAYAAKAEATTPSGEKPYVPPSFCCGVAGVVDFFCDLYRVTGDAEHAAFAKKAGAYLVDIAIADGDGKKWKNGASVPGGPVASDSEACNVDLMLGASGEALALLHLMTLEQKVDPIRHMPDRRVKKD
jgi:lantibiotic modifying enzyme